MEARDIVANKDVARVLLQKKIQSAKTPEEKEKFEKEMFELMQVTFDCLSGDISYTNPSSSTVTDNIPLLYPSVNCRICSVTSYFFNMNMQT